MEVAATTTAALTQTRRNVQGHGRFVPSMFWQIHLPYSTILIMRGHCVLKWGFTWTFPGNQDATKKKMSELTFISMLHLDS